jgi:hypothetical protein
MADSLYIGRDKDYDKCMRALFLTNPLDDLAAIRRSKGKRVDGTCEWLLRLEKYTTWLNGDGPQILRLTGAPGIGKTIISSVGFQLLGTL